MVRLMWLGMALMLTLGVGAAAPKKTEPIPSSFAKPQEAATKALKATIGKPIQSGFVFVDGRYLPPPYTVERYGNVIRINKVQVTREVVPWSEFVKTQAGATVVKAEEPKAEAEIAAPEPEPEPEEEEEYDDSDSSLDDLFDDNPAPKKKAAPKKKRTGSVRPKPRKSAVTYAFNGEFEPNEKTRAYVAKINDARTRIDKHLRSGGCYFFGSRYSVVSCDAGSAKLLIGKLPEIMRDNSNAEGFERACQQAGLSFMPHQLMLEVFRNRFVCHELINRRKSMQEQENWAKLLSGGK